MARNLRNAMLYDLSFVVVVVVVFSSHFLKENLFWGGSCVGSVGSFCPKCVFGCQENVQKVSWDSDRWFGFGTRANFDDSSKSALKQCTINGATCIYSIVKTNWTSWMGFGLVEWSRWGLVVIPFGKWSSGKKIVHIRWILPEKSVLTVFTL